MALTQSQRAIFEKAREASSSKLGVGLTEGESNYLAALIVRDLELEDQFPAYSFDFPELYEQSPFERQELDSEKFWPRIERLMDIEPNADTYFSCLASLYKKRRKYARILQHQAFATLEQVGPRSLLQYGMMETKSLTALLPWRKWLYDIDNRAAQESGYLFEPILAASIGGVPVNSRNSPVKRTRNAKKARQVDCIREKTAYEFKLRVTMAASGQGRWREELQFPSDCEASGYTPVLIVLDETPNPKLAKLEDKFEDHGGRSFTGSDAWAHLEEVAGPAMTPFLEKYVRGAIDDVLANEHPAALPSIEFVMRREVVEFIFDNEVFEIPRAEPFFDSEADDMPDDVSDELIPGPSE